MVSGVHSAVSPSTIGWPMSALLDRIGYQSPLHQLNVYLDQRRDTIVITFRVNGQVVLLSDEKFNFPSDRLVNQINLLRD